MRNLIISLFTAMSTITHANLHEYVDLMDPNGIEGGCRNVCPICLKRIDMDALLFWEWGTFEVVSREELEDGMAEGVDLGNGLIGVTDDAGEIVDAETPLDFCRVTHGCPECWMNRKGAFYGVRSEEIHEKKVERAGIVGECLLRAGARCGDVGLPAHVIACIVAYDAGAPNAGDLLL